MGSGLKKPHQIALLLLSLGTANQSESKQFEESWAGTTGTRGLGEVENIQLTRPPMKSIKKGRMGMSQLARCRQLRHV